MPDCLSRKEVDEIELEPIIDMSAPEFGSEDHLEIINKINADPDLFPDLRVLDNKVYKRMEHADGDELNESFT